MNRGSTQGYMPKEFQVVASMRPRFMNRGSAGRDVTAESCDLRFNEAPIHESGK